MKKLKVKKHKQSATISSGFKFSPLVGLLVVTITAIVGVMVLKASFAATGAGTVYVQVRWKYSNTSTLHPVPSIFY